jgi:microcystin-dependent protein
MSKRSVLFSGLLSAILVLLTISVFGMQPKEAADITELRKELDELKAAAAEQRKLTTGHAEDISQISRRVSRLSRTHPPVGTVLPYAGEAVPDGWLPCDGDKHDLERRSELLPLAGVLGAKFHDEAKKTLTVPDLRGRVVVGAGQGKTLEGNALSARKLGDIGGTEEDKLEMAQLPKSGVTIPNMGPTMRNAPDPGNLYKTVSLRPLEGGFFAGNVVVAHQTYKTSWTTAELGEGRAVKHMPPYFVMSYIIKY